MRSPRRDRARAASRPTLPATSRLRTRVHTMTVDDTTQDPTRERHHHDHPLWTTMYEREGVARQSPERRYHNTSAQVTAEAPKVSDPHRSLAVMNMDTGLDGSKSG